MVTYMKEISREKYDDDKVGDRASNSNCIPSLYASPSPQQARMFGLAMAIDFNGGECIIVDDACCPGPKDLMRFTEYRIRLPPP